MSGIWRNMVWLAVLTASGGGAATAQVSDDAMLEAMLSGRAPIPAQEIAARAAKAAAHPLGSRNNPIRAAAPAGQRAYLARLRCADGKAPDHKRIGNFGLGPYHAIIDGYAVRCAGAEPVTLFLDLYHPGHVETGAPAGFTIVPAEPVPSA